MDLEQFIARIEHAFAGVRRGAGISWREAEEIDNHASDEELAAARALDTDMDWHDVNPRLMDELPSAVSFLNAEGVRYYFPAFMISDLRRSGKWLSAVDEGFERWVGNPDRWRELVPLLSPDQLEVIQSWYLWKIRSYSGRRM